MAVLEARNAELEAQVTWLREHAAEEWVSPETYGREHEHPVVTIRVWIKNGTLAPGDWRHEGGSVRIRRSAVPAPRPRTRPPRNKRRSGIEQRHESGRGK
jgi:hypothetical protein